MRTSQHSRLVLMIAAISLGSLRLIAPVWANGQDFAPRQVAMAAHSKSMEETERAAEPALAVIRQVLATKSNLSVQVRIVASGDLSCTPFRLTAPDRLVLDCAGARVRVHPEPGSVEMDPVRAIRVGQFKPDVARVVLDLVGQPPYDIRNGSGEIVITFGPVPSIPPAVNAEAKGPEPISPALPKSNESVIPSVAKSNESTFPVVFPSANPEVAGKSVSAKKTGGDSRVPPSAETPAQSNLMSAPALVSTPEAVPSSRSESPVDAVEAEAAKETSHAAPSDGEYVIGAQDVLAINVWHETELSRSVPVRPDGKISLPLVGDIMVSGLTPRMLQDRLTEQLDSFIRKPKVTVIVQEVNSHKFYILGQVDKPGAYPLASHVAVLDALAMAGGFRDFAKVQQIYLLRLMPDGTRKRIGFDYKAALNGKGTYRDIEIQTGDTIVVP